LPARWLTDQIRVHLLRLHFSSRQYRGA
jgi:hypothetical protein